MLPLLVAVLTAACFAPALSNGFVHWDDDLLLLDNPHWRGLGPTQLRWMLTTAHGGHYEPLTWLSFALDHAVWGMDPRGYHLTNVLLHAANAALVYALAVVLLRRAGRADDGRLRLAAAAGALLFAIHPLRAEPVAWVSERRLLLCTAFYVLALLAYVRMTEGRRPRLWLAMSVLCVGLSLLSQAWAMTIPAVLLVLDAYPLRRVRRERLGALLVEKLAYVPLAAAAAVLATRTLAEAGSLRPSLAEYGVGQRLAQAAFGLCFYVGRTLVPRGLSPLYPVDLRLDPTAPAHLLCGTLVVGTAIALVALRRRAPWALAAAAASAIVLSPLLGFAQAGPHAMADRYTYLASLPWAVVVAGVLDVGLRRRPAALAAVVAAVAVLVPLTVRQTRIWRDSITLWTHALRVDPRNVGAFVQRGWARQRDGDLVGAIADYDAALRLDPDDPLAHNQRGLARHRLGEADAAIADYSAAIAAKPDYGAAYYNRGISRQAKGDAEGASADYEHAIALDARDPRPWNNRGVLRATRGDFAGAIADYSRAVELEPDFALALVNRARARRLAGDVPGAIADVETAIRRAPPAWAGCPRARALLAELGVAEAALPACAPSSGAEASADRPRGP
ncbi:MAG TPA: tetratricopeptide repeat protein [Candidatus Binatia bacterium]|nr:tetratricopeptide repeat protein [Candidatus Binatia bacterium]